MKSVVLTLAAMQALCPGKHFAKGRWMEADVGGPRISYSQGELAGYSQPVQKFIVLHECGHSHGKDSEISADSYAFARTQVTRPMVDEICQMLNSSPADRPRCKNLRRMLNERDGRR